MESKVIPTVDEFCKNYLKENWTSEYCSMDVVTILMPKAMHEYAVLFARHHREQQIEATSEILFSELGAELSKLNKNDLISILNAYPEDRIK